MSGRAESYKIWLDNIGDEIDYWDHYIGTSGGDYPEDFQFRLKHDTHIGARDGHLANLISRAVSPAVSILDVGSGPLTNLGKLVPGKSVRITSCDPLADIYNKLLERRGITPPVRTAFADAENLSHFFPSEKFDVVHCANALDHSYDPFSAIIEMLKVVKQGGFIKLGHFENEALSENYHGLHQWNFTERDGDFVIWDREKDVSLTSFFEGAAYVDAVRSPQEPKHWISAVIRRNELTDEFLLRQKSSLAHKYRISLERHFLRHLE